MKHKFTYSGSRGQLFSVEADNANEAEKTLAKVLCVKHDCDFKYIYRLVASEMISDEEYKRGRFDLFSEVLAQMLQEPYKYADIAAWLVNLVLAKEVE